MNYSLELHKLNTIYITSLVHGLGVNVMSEGVRAFSSGLVPLFLSKFATDRVASLWRFWGYRPVNPHLINKVVCKILSCFCRGHNLDADRILRQTTFIV